jgi:hypothetical protein
MISVEADGLGVLIADLDDATAQALPEVRKVVQRGALQIKTNWARRWSGHPHYPSLGAAVSYDSDQTPAAVEAEIGPDKERRQGALGNLIEYGSVNSAPNPGGLPALAAEEPRFAAALEDLAERLVSGRG